MSDISATTSKRSLWPTVLSTGVDELLRDEHLPVRMQHVPGILLVEGNADRLAREGMSTQLNRFEGLLGGLVDAGQLRVTRLRVRSESDLEMARILAPLARYDAVLLLAHGSVTEVEATDNRSLQWAEVAKMLAPIEPRALLAISCWAASSGPARALFEGIPSLAMIGGSPTLLSVRHAELAFIELVAAAFGLSMPREVSALASMYNAAETGGVVGWRRRETFEAASDDDHLLIDFGAALAKVLMG